MDKSRPVFCLCLVIFIMCPGCLFGEKEEKRAVVYPVATAAVPQKRPVERPVEEPEKKLSRSKILQLKIDKRLDDISRETKEAQGDLLVRITALEEDYQQLRDKLSLIEFLQEESSNEMEKMRESLEFEMETLRGQIEDYNALLVKILDKISSSPEATVQPEFTP